MTCKHSWLLAFIHSVFVIALCLLDSSISAVFLPYSHGGMCGKAAKSLTSHLNLAESPLCIWPVTGQGFVTLFSSTAGQGFQNTKWPAVLYSQ